MPRPLALCTDTDSGDPHPLWHLADNPAGANAALKAPYFQDHKTFEQVTLSTASGEWGMRVGPSEPRDAG
jgi:hypothetical protein